MTANWIHRSSLPSLPTRSSAPSRSFPLPFSPVRLNKAGRPPSPPQVSVLQSTPSELCSVGRRDWMHFTTLIFGLVSPSKLFLPLLLHFLYPVSCQASRRADVRRGRPERSPAAPPPSQDAATSTPPQGRRRRTWLRLARAEQCVCRVVRRRHSRPRSSQGTQQAKEEAGGIREKPPERAAATAAAAQGSPADDEAVLVEGRPSARALPSPTSRQKGRPAVRVGGGAC